MTNLVFRFLKWLWVVTGHELPRYAVNLDKSPIPSPAEEHTFGGIVRMIVYHEYITQYAEEQEKEDEPEEGKI